MAELLRSLGWRSRSGELLVVLVATLIGALLRASLLGTGLWRDEAYTYFDASAGELKGLINRLLLGETHPPLFFLIEFVWGRLAGWADVMLKVPAYIFGVGLIPATYLFARSAGGRWCATIAAALVACDARQIYYSVDARPYSLSAFEIVVTAALFSAWLRRPNFATAIATAVMGTLLVYTQYSGVIFIASIGIYALGFLKGRRRFEALAGLGAIGVAFLPWTTSALAQLEVAAPWRPWIPYAIRPLAALQLLGGTLPIVGQDGTSALCAGVLLVAALLIVRRRLFSNPPLAISALGLVLGASFEAAFSSQDMRYMVAFAPLALTLTAWLASAALSALRERTGLRQRPRVAVLAAGALLALIVLDGVQFTRETSGRAKSGMRALAARSAASAERTLFLCAPDYSAATLDFYGRGRLRIKGFARWDRPEIFDLHGYPEMWRDPGLLRRTLANVDRARTRGSKELVLVYGGRAGARPVDVGRVRYGIVRRLQAALLGRYRIVSVEQFDGIEESFTAYRLRLQGATVTLRKVLPVSGS